MQLTPHTASFRHLAALALVVVAATGCQEPFSPYWDRGSYDLRYANNRRVPTVVIDGPGASFTEITDGSLILRRDHSYQLVVDVHERAGDAYYTYSAVFAGDYDNDGRTLYLSYFDADAGYYGVILATWRDGRVEMVVPRVNGYDDVLCEFHDW